MNNVSRTISQANEASSALARIAAVDITRVVAAWVLMICHLSSSHGNGLTHLTAHFLDIGIAPVDSVFFVFSGYFACRNVTGKKAWRNSVWCLVAYLVWNFIAFAALCVSKHDVLGGLTWQSVVIMLGMGQLLPGNHGAAPIDGPLWYMRDLFFLFLLSPILFRWIRYIFPLSFFCSIFPQTAELIYHDAHSILSWYSVLFFCGGAFLRSLDNRKQKFLLQYYSSKLICTYWILVAVIWSIDTLNGFSAIDFKIFENSLQATRYGAVFYMLSLCMLYQTARWVEDHSPKFTQLALKLAPVTFLTYASHWIFWAHLPNYVLDHKLSVFLPIIVFALMYLLFIALKRWCRPLLHPVAYYKDKSAKVS